MISLSEQVVRKLVIPDGKARLIVADAACRGLYLDVRPRGRTYRYRYTDRSGKAQTVTIGNIEHVTLAQARAKVYDLAQKVHLGQDLQEERIRRTASPTYREFIEGDYSGFARTAKRSHADELKLIQNHLFPIFGDVRLPDITRSAIKNMMETKLADGYSASMVNRILSTLKGTLSRAVEWEVPGMAQSVAKGIRQLPNPNRVDRFLAADEATRLYRAVLESSNSLLPHIVAFLLLTGARKREALDAQWQHIDLKNRIWTVPLSKSGRPRYIPLSDDAVKVLLSARAEIRRLLPDCQPANVFPNPSTGKPFVTFYVSWNTARKKAGLQEVRVHDLRHSFASALVNQGMTLYDVKEILGHANMSTTTRYAHLSKQRLNAAASVAGNYFRPE